MSNAKFTKGEWAVSIQGFDDFKSIAVIVPNGGFEVINIPDAEANAHLIAAAPDMYAMIEELTSELFIAIDEVNDQRASRVTSQTENEPDYMDMQTIHEAQLLLKKARGE
tara:strand:- start:20 stop:349 length:330 start_codon:yes stop_codon:yes gene_type:complete